MVLLFFLKLTYERRHEITENFANAKTKAQISFAVIAKLISTFVFATQYNSSCTYYQNFKLLTFFWDYIGQFVSDGVGTSKDRFSRVATHEWAQHLSETV